MELTLYRNAVEVENADKRIGVYKMHNYTQIDFVSPIKESEKDIPPCGYVEKDGMKTISIKLSLEGARNLRHALDEYLFIYDSLQPTPKRRTAL